MMVTAWWCSVIVVGKGVMSSTHHHDTWHANKEYLPDDGRHVMGAGTPVEMDGNECDIVPGGITSPPNVLLIGLYTLLNLKVNVS